MCSFTPVYHAPPLFLSPSPLLQEELEEGGTAVYDDFKFVTREELDSLRLTELMGTNLLRPFMHGFFIHSRLYHKVPHAAIDQMAACPLVYPFQLLHARCCTCVEHSSAPSIVSARRGQGYVCCRLLSVSSAPPRSISRGQCDS